MKKVTIVLPLICSLLWISCAEPSQKKAKEKNADSKEEALKEKAKAPMKEHMNRAFYPIPSPEQMFGFINDAGVAYSKGLTNPAKNAEQYVDPSAKALNFGVYTADLAYAAAYEDIQSTLELYKTVRKMSAELNIDEMMTEEMMKKVQANLEQKDSLTIIAGRSYYQAVEYLERNEMQGKLALMSLGGWVESIYLTINAMQGFEKDSETVQRIADQKITFGNLYTYLRKNEKETGVKEALKEVQDIRGVFGSLVEKKIGETNSSSQKKKLVLGGEKKITMTEAQFNELKKVVNQYRSKITGEAL
ncbi:MAG: hypothetical protein RIC95_08545 [Vicingaceae bacterium]